MAIKKKKKLLGNRTWVGHIMSKHITHQLSHMTRASVLCKTNGEVLTPNILARKSEERLLPHCKKETKSEDSNQPGPLVSRDKCQMLFHFTPV
jgi:hypothetical protein